MTALRLLAAPLAVTGLIAAPAAWAGNLEPSGLNLGNTSFFDGFSSTHPGWAYIGYLQDTHYDRIADNQGHAAAGVIDPRIDATLLVNQFAYTSSQTLFDGRGHLGFNAILPLARLDADVDAASPVKLRARSGVGDVTFAVSLQFDPVIDRGRPVFSQRFELGAIAPVGSYDASRDVNPGSNFWSIVPNWAATWLPTPRTEVSWRLNYLYNFANDKPANLPPTVTRTRAGQAAWLNFTASYAVKENLNIGLNGYYFRQFTDDRYSYVGGGSDNWVFGDTGRALVLAIGPGLSWKAGRGNIVNINAYAQTEVRNRSRGATLNLNWVHPL